MNYIGNISVHLNNDDQLNKILIKNDGDGTIEFLISILNTDRHSNQFDLTEYPDTSTDSYTFFDDKPADSDSFFDDTPIDFDTFSDDKSTEKYLNNMERAAENSIDYRKYELEVENKFMAKQKFI